VYQAIMTSIDMFAPGFIRSREPKIAERDAAAVEFISTDELRRLRDAARARNDTRIHSDFGTFRLEVIEAIMQWRIRQDRRVSLLLVAVWLIGVTAAITAAATGWYTATP
jgi:hypothetical protein